MVDLLNEVHALLSEGKRDKALIDAFTWIITHNGKTDRRYATFYFFSKSLGKEDNLK